MFGITKFNTQEQKTQKNNSKSKYMKFYNKTTFKVNQTPCSKLNVFTCPATGENDKPRGKI